MKQQLEMPATVLTEPAVTTDITAVAVRNRAGQVRTIDELTTLFDLCLVVVDGWRPEQLDHMAPLIERLHRVLGDADCTFGLLAVGVGPEHAVALAGPLSDRVAVFADPHGTAADALGVPGAPSLVWVDTQPALRAVVAGWDGQRWRPVLAELARKLAWTRPLVPVPGDPAPMDAEAFTLRSATITQLPARSHEAREEEQPDARIAV